MLLSLYGKASPRGQTILLIDRFSAADFSVKSVVMIPLRLAGILSILAWAYAGKLGGATLDASDALFTNGPVPTLRIQIPAANIEKLRDNPRQSIQATVQAGTNVWRDVGIHIKGSIGSFRSIDGKPSLT